MQVSGYPLPLGFLNRQVLGFEPLQLDVAHAQRLLRADPVGHIGPQFGHVVHRDDGEKILGRGFLLRRAHGELGADHEMPFKDRIPGVALRAPVLGQFARVLLPEEPEITGRIAATLMQEVVQMKSPDGFDATQVPALNRAIGANHAPVAIHQANKLRHRIGGKLQLVLRFFQRPHVHVANLPKMAASCGRSSQILPLQMTGAWVFCCWQQFYHAIISYATDKILVFIMRRDGLGTCRT